MSGRVSFDKIKKKSSNFVWSEDTVELAEQRMLREMIPFRRG